MTENMINDYIRIRDLIKPEAKKQYKQRLLEKNLKDIPYAYNIYQDIENDLIAERMQFEIWQADLDSK